MYVVELIWRAGSFDKSTEEGVELLLKVVEIGSANACVTLADFYHKGEFGFEKSPETRDAYRKRGLKYDCTTYDPRAG